MYYLQSRYYDPETGRFINADVYATTGQGLLGNNMFAYCRNNPVSRLDITGTTDEDAEDRGGRFVGLGIQFELNVGAYECGVEIIVYFDNEVCGGDGPMVSVYVYEGMGVNLLDLYSSPDFINTVNQLTTAITTNACKESYGKADLIALQALLFKDTGLSISVLGIYGYDNFKSSKDYEGAFSTVSGSAKHVKISYSYSPTCWTLAIGATTSTKFSLGFGQTNYQQIM